MSAFLLGMGFRADMGTCVRKLVLLKLIDACEDDGSRIFPAVATVAVAAQCSTRQVQREIKSFLDVGLIKLVREGGKGRRSTNEYAMDLDVLQEITRRGWNSVADAAKGDTVSPLNPDAKGDTDDTFRVTPETPKGDSWSRTTPPDSSLDPSIERARADAGETPATETEPDEDDPRAIERAYWRIVKDWPGFAGMPKEAAKRDFMALSAEERAAAERKRDAWLALLKAQGKRHVAAPSTYFREKLWKDVADGGQRDGSAVLAQAFGRLWGAERMRELLAGPVAHMPRPPAFLQHLFDGEDGERHRRAYQASAGFPKVNWMHTRAGDGQPITVATAIELLGELMEPVPVGGVVWQAWKDEHERRGWPWLPDTGKLGAVWFPKGGPEGLGAFMEAVSKRCTERAA
jgi:hypothetical protein